MVWGSGVRGPGKATPEDDVDDGVLFIDQHTHHEKTPDSWGLKTVERTDINQGDIAPLMVCILSKFLDSIASCAVCGVVLMSVCVFGSRHFWDFRVHSIQLVRCRSSFWLLTRLAPFTSHTT